MIKQKIIQLQQILQTITNSELPFFQIKDTENNVLYEGITIFYLLKEYSARYMIANSADDLFFKWTNYNTYKLPDFLRAYAALYSEYNPINNYDMIEKSVDLNNTGDIDRVRSTDESHNTVVTASKYDYTTDTTADSENKPTTNHYTTTYEDANTGRLQSYDTTTGKTTAHTLASDDDKNKTTVTDDMKITNAEQHKLTTMTIDDTTYSADDIKAHELQRSGNIGTVSTQMMINQELEVRKQSLIYDYVYDFINRYTFYAAGGECYEYITID